MKYYYLLVGIAIMALMTYLPRVIPLALCRKKITNPYIKSFLLYMPYTVLAAVTFPDLFTSTESVLSAGAGCLVALLLSFRKLGLLTVALCATGTVFLAEQLLTLF